MSFLALLPSLHIATLLLINFKAIKEVSAKLEPVIQYFLLPFQDEYFLLGGQRDSSNLINK